VFLNKLPSGFDLIPHKCGKHILDFFKIAKKLLTKAAGTDESAPNQLVIYWNDLT